MKWTPVAGLVLAILVTVTLAASAETAKEAFDRGGELMEQGSFEDALKAYAAAAQAEPANLAYRDQFFVLRQVLMLRSAMDQEQDQARWLQMAQAVRSFYASQGLLSTALEIDRQVHAKAASASSAGQLAETLLAMKENGEAATVLSSLAEEKRTPATQALLGIALARQEEMEPARKICAAIELDGVADPGTLYVASRLHAAVGNSQQAFDLLGRCFENVPPSLLVNLKLHAQKTPEFAAFVSSDGFAQALETESKIPESQCSGGTSCAGCPMRGSCPSDAE